MVTMMADDPTAHDHDRDRPDPDPLVGLLLGRIASGLWRVGAFTPSQAATAGSFGSAVAEVDPEPLTDKTRLLATFADSLSFPAWFGHNWDALAECLGDWASHDGRLLVVRGLSQLDAGLSETLVDILHDCFKPERGGSSCLIVSSDISSIPSLDEV